MYGNGSSILRIGAIKVFRWKSGRPTLTVTVPGYADEAPKLRYGWKPFFVGHHGQEKTVWSYRRVAA
jgi:hypothetical protein